MTGGGLMTGTTFAGPLLGRVERDAVTHLGRGAVAVAATLAAAGWWLLGFGRATDNPGEALLRLVSGAGSAVLGVMAFSAVARAVGEARRTGVLGLLTMAEPRPWRLAMNLAVPAWASLLPLALVPLPLVAISPLLGGATGWEAARTVLNLAAWAVLAGSMGLFVATHRRPAVAAAYGAAVLVAWEFLAGNVAWTGGWWPVSVDLRSLLVAPSPDHLMPDAYAAGAAVFAAANVWTAGLHLRAAEGAAERPRRSWRRTRRASGRVRGNPHAWKTRRFVLGGPVGIAVRVLAGVLLVLAYQDGLTRANAEMRGVGLYLLLAADAAAIGSRRLRMEEGQVDLLRLLPGSSGRVARGSRRPVLWWMGGAVLVGWTACWAAFRLVPGFTSAPWWTVLPGLPAAVLALPPVLMIAGRSAAMLAVRNDGTSPGPVGWLIAAAAMGGSYFIGMRLAVRRNWGRPMEWETVVLMALYVAGPLVLLVLAMRLLERGPLLTRQLVRGVRLSDRRGDDGGGR